MITMRIHDKHTAFIIMSSRKLMLRVALKFCDFVHNSSLLGRHGSVSLCRVERENKMAATYNVLAFKR